MLSFITRSSYSLTKDIKVESISLIHKPLYDFLSNIEKCEKYYIDLRDSSNPLFQKFINILNYVDKEELFKAKYTFDVLPLKYVQDNIDIYLCKLVTGINL